MPRFSFSLDVAAAPHDVIGAMVDFSDRRPEIWPYLSSKLYKVHSVEAKKADVTEGSDLPGGSIWSRETYDWSDPNVVKFVITESNFFKPGGTVEFRVEPRGSGSRIHFTLHREAKNGRAKIVAAILQASNGAWIKRSYYKVYGKPT